MKIHLSTLGVGVASGLACLCTLPAQAQITANFTNTRPVTVLINGNNVVTNVLDVERGTSSGAGDVRKLSALITVDPGYIFDGFNVLTLPSNEAGNPITSSDYFQDPAFSSAVGRTSTTANPFVYNNGVLDFNLRAGLPTGLYYRYALNGGAGFAASFIRFQARNTTTNEVSNVTLNYGINVVEAGALAAPEPGTLALGLCALPLVGGILIKRRGK